MKIALTSSGKTLDSILDLRFGRAAGFILLDTDSGNFSFIDNTQNLEAAQGAGIQAAQHVVNAGAQAIITGHTGPKAFKVLQAAKIPVFLAKGGTVAEAAEAWKQGALAEITEADVEGHWV
ncbi:MAG: dinitrogenase iron-molybdenum cofactor biosynthesis protein [Treponema sp.]|jgi:predicted Fe-Mo cluster-binding NifX family protein|nr:MAG: dinitrogenase iron-molybdenum cofactor biosynthesis protein [Treponema sp.]